MTKQMQSAALCDVIYVCLSVEM